MRRTIIMLLTLIMFSVHCTPTFATEGNEKKAVTIQLYQGNCTITLPSSQKIVTTYFVDNDRVMLQDELLSMILNSLDSRKYTCSRSMEFPSVNISCNEKTLSFDADRQSVITDNDIVKLDCKPIFYYAVYDSEFGDSTPLLSSILLPARFVVEYYGFNTTFDESSKTITIVIDELADIYADSNNRKIMEPILCRLAAKSRSFGVSLLVCTQKASSEVVSTVFRSNMPLRIALKTDNVSYRCILDSPPSFSLLGRGDAIAEWGGKTIRFQSSCISTTDERETEISDSVRMYWNAAGYYHESIIPDITEAVHRKIQDNSENSLEIKLLVFLSEYRLKHVPVDAETFVLPYNRNDLRNHLSCSKQNLSDVIAALEEKAYLSRDGLVGRGSKTYVNISHDQSKELLAKYQPVSLKNI